MSAIHDTDQWVSMVGEILRTYPATGSLNLELEDNNTTFAEVLSDLRKLGELTVLYTETCCYPRSPGTHFLHASCVLPLKRLIFKPVNQ